MTTTTFPISAVQRLRERAARRARPPEDGPERWSKSIVDPMKVLAVFTPLWVKDGYVLRAYQFREGGDGRGVVWAMPVDADFPEPCDCKKDRKRALQPPRPPAALDNEMEAIDGDGSPWSYLCDSLLGRELWSFGAIRRQRLAHPYDPGQESVEGKAEGGGHAFRRSREVDLASTPAPRLETAGDGERK